MNSTLSLPRANRDAIGLNYYAPPHPDDLLATTADVVFGGCRSKMHGAKKGSEATALHDADEGVLFLDEDVEILFDPDAFLRRHRFLNGVRRPAAFEAKFQIWHDAR